MDKEKVINIDSAFPDPTPAPVQQKLPNHSDPFADDDDELDWLKD
jgi:hypothetical protein